MIITNSTIFKKVIIASLGFSLLVVAGCGGGGGNSNSVSKSTPVISNVAAVLPAGFDSNGGIVTINATISDKNQIMEVNASATCVNRNQISKQLGPSGEGNVYTANIKVPANTSANEEDDVYTLVVDAVNANNVKGTSTAVTFKVPAPPPPPDPPSGSL